MSTVVALSLLVLVLALAAVAVIVMVVAGIRGDERRMSLSDAPTTRVRAVARRVLGVHATTENTIQRARADVRR
jgi:hypothetical protein